MRELKEAARLAHIDDRDVESKGALERLLRFHYFPEVDFPPCFYPSPLCPYLSCKLLSTFVSNMGRSSRRRR